MNKFTRDEQIAAIIKSNLVSFVLNPQEIRVIVEQATADIVHLLENYLEITNNKISSNTK